MIRCVYGNEKFVFVGEYGDDKFVFVGEYGGRILVDI